MMYIKVYAVPCDVVKAVQAGVSAAEQVVALAGHVYVDDHV